MAAPARVIQRQRNVGGLRDRSSLGLPTGGIEAADTSDDSLEGGGNRRLGRVGKALLAFDRVVMDLGSECVLDSACGAADGNPISSASNGCDGEALIPEPGNELIQIVLADAKAIGVLLRLEP